MAASLKESGSYTSEYRVKRRDGSVLYVMDIGKLITDRDGERVISCFITDITKHKMQELHLIQANKESRSRQISSRSFTIHCRAGLSSSRRTASIGLSMPTAAPGRFMGLLKRNIGSRYAHRFLLCWKRNARA